MRGHVPYRKDCRYCVEGAGLGVQHRKVKHPQAYTLSVDLFGPMPAAEKGRDEQSISGNPHLRFGLVGVFRLPKSTVSPVVKPDQIPLPEGTPLEQTGQEAVEDEYEPSEPGEVLSEEMLELIRSVPGYEGGVDVEQNVQAVEADVDQDGDITGEHAEGAWIDKEELEGVVKDLKSGVELVTLRFFVGLKTKTGADVTAGIQQIILKITQLYPLKILHCDPGTEFVSDALARWLPGQGVRMQNTIPTDKQSNGLAERTVGWFKSRARTLLAANSLPANYWPVAMRWAAEAYNRSVLGQTPLPAFGQQVLHKLKRPPGAQKELLTRWFTASYAAPHLTVPDGHVLITAEGNLVASKGFRLGVLDPKTIEGLEMPLIQEEEDALPDAGQDGLEPPTGGEVMSTPNRRLRDKTTVRFVSGDNADNDSPEALAKMSLMDDDLSERSFLQVAEALERAGSHSRDRRGELTGRFVFGAFSHGGQRGVTSCCKTQPLTTQFLNKFLRTRVDKDVPMPTWSTVMLIHASNVAVHRDYRNEWGSQNYAICVSGPVQLWVGPPKDPKVDVNSIVPEWESEATTTLGRAACCFDPRNYHAVRKRSDWVLVGYTQLGTKKLMPTDRDILDQLGFPLSPPH